MLAPILQAAFRLSLAATLLAVTASTGLIFFWVWNYFRLHPPSDLNEYIEAGTISLIYAIAGLLVWTLVNHLRYQTDGARREPDRVGQAKERLLVEEKLAAVGRFSTAIAHEIRNPVAMISSALTTAFSRGAGFRGEPGDVRDCRQRSVPAGKADDGLPGLRPSAVAIEGARRPWPIPSHTSPIFAGRAQRKGTLLSVAEGPEGLWADIDGGQIQQALLNLAMNAIEASPSGAVGGIARDARQGADTDRGGEYSRPDSG